MALLYSVLCGLLSMVTYGFSNAYSKPLAQKYGPAPVLFLRGLTVSATLIIASGWNYGSLHDLTAGAATILLGVAGYIPVLAFTHAIKNSRLGIVAPIAGTAPLVTVLLAFLFLGVQISFVQWFAICLVIFANVAVSFNFKNWRDSNALQISSGVPFAIVAASGWGLFYFFLVPSTQALGPFLSACLAEIGVTFAAGLHVWFGAKSCSIKDALEPAMAVNGLLICMGTVAFTVGVTYFNIGIVGTLSNSVAIVTTLIGAFAFGERLHVKEKIAAATMIFGIAMISIG
jgi:drug/metabolite transporter (DMT)-like permease